jgi:glutamyl-tRNA synthetase
VPGSIVRTRFAPSPTGYLHIGGVRTALFNWLFARHHGGQFILRIDDTDVARNLDETLQPILDGFRWLGLDWDEGPVVGGPYAPYYQSQRVGRHQEAVRELLACGHAYRDYATAEEIQTEREAAQTAKRRFLYSRRWMAETDDRAARFEAEGRRAVIRLKMPREGVCVLDDLVRGHVAFEWALEQDHVVQRADGTCLYHLASAVDDHDFGITHVIRAVEHLSNTPRQVFIMEALGYGLPRYAHLPYVAEPGSAEKLSKRKLAKYLKHPDFRRLYDHGLSILAALGRPAPPETFSPVIVDFYREVGYLPDALVNYLLLLGWSLDDRTEVFTREEMIAHFTLDRVNRAAASFDPQKLFAFQDRHMQALPLERRVGFCLPFLRQAGLIGEAPGARELDRTRRIVEAAGDRIKVAGDVLFYAELFQPDTAFAYDEAAFDRQLRTPGAGERLQQFRTRLASVEPFDAPALEAALNGFAAETGVAKSQVVHPLRVAVTGKPVGFGLFETLAILGREPVVARIDRALAKMKDDGNPR